MGGGNGRLTGRLAVESTESGYMRAKVGPKAKVVGCRVIVGICGVMTHLKTKLISSK